MISFWIIVAIMAPVTLFGGVAAFLIIGSDRRIEAALASEEEAHWISLV